MLNRTHNVNFIHTSVCFEDVELLFGPFEDSDYFVEIENDVTLEALVSRYLQKFPSISQARKNGWHGPIPPGFREWKIGKTKFWTFVPFDDQSVTKPRFWDSDVVKHAELSS